MTLLISLGPHAAFIWLAYATAAAVLAGLAGWLYVEGNRHARRLAELEARGLRRRSGGTGTDT